MSSAVRTSRSWSSRASIIARACDIAVSEVSKAVSGGSGPAYVALATSTPDASHRLMYSRRAAAEVCTSRAAIACMSLRISPLVLPSATYSPRASRITSLNSRPEVAPGCWLSTTRTSSWNCRASLGVITGGRLRTGHRPRSIRRMAVMLSRQGRRFNHPAYRVAVQSWRREDWPLPPEEAFA